MDIITKNLMDAVRSSYEVPDADTIRSKSQERKGVMSRTMNKITEAMQDTATSALDSVRDLTARTVSKRSEVDIEEEAKLSAALVAQEREAAGISISLIPTVDTDDVSPNLQLINPDKVRDELSGDRRELGSSEGYGPFTEDGETTLGRGLMSRDRENVDAIESYKSETMEVQKLLRVSADGQAGKKSMKALNSFQRRAGLPVTDNFYDPATVESLKAVENTTQRMLDRIAEGEGATQADLDKFQGKGTSAYDMVLGYGKFGKPSKPISNMTLVELEVYMKELIKNSKGKIKGKAAKNKGSSAVGKYQVVYKSLFGSSGSAANPEKKSWAAKLGYTEDTIYSPELQEEIGRFALQEAGFDNWMKNEKSENNMWQDLAGKWASISGNDYEQHIATNKKDLEPFLMEIRDMLNLPGKTKVVVPPERSLRPQARPTTQVASN